MARRRKIKLKNAAPVIAVCMAVSILLIALSASLYLKGMELRDIEVKSLYFGISGDECELTAELRGFDELDVVEDSLAVSFGNHSLPLSNERSNVTSTLNETHFKSLSEEEKARISGKIKAFNTPIWHGEMSLDVDIDLSFIHTLARSISVTDVEVVSVEEGNMSIHLEIEADLSREVVMDMDNVTGKVISGHSRYDLIVSSLRLGSDGSGHADLEIPTASVLTLFILQDPITLSAWGFEIDIN